MIRWQPHPPALSDARRSTSSGGRCPDLSTELTLPDQTGVFTVPTPAELGGRTRRCAALLCDLVDVPPVRRALVRKLAAMVQRLGASERELFALAREVLDEVDDIPVHRRRQARAQARAVDSATG